MTRVGGKGRGSIRCGLAALFCCAFLAGCKVELHSRLTENEANTMLAALAGEGIKASKEAGDDKGWKVSVDEADFGAALDVLRVQGLPAERFVSIGDMFQKQGLVSTPSEERMRYIHAVSQELSNTLLKVDGVIAARVHVSVPANDPLRDALRPSHAAVFIKHRPDADLRLLVPSIKELVAHSIDGLTHDNVSLALFETRRAAPATGPRGGTTPASNAAPVQVWGLVLGSLAAALLAFAVLPPVLRKHGLDWRRRLRRVLSAR